MEIKIENIEKIMKLFVEFRPYKDLMIYKMKGDYAIFLKYGKLYKWKKELSYIKIYDEMNNQIDKMYYSQWSKFFKIFSPTLYSNGLIKLNDDMPENSKNLFLKILKKLNLEYSIINDDVDKLLLYNNVVN